jgi:hypothetical protein
MEDFLWPHPAEPSTCVDEIRVTVRRPSTSTLRLRFSVIGCIAGIVIPEPAAPLRANNLWRSTCFEIFVRASGQTDYREFNFAPSTQWAAYEFDAYRANMREASLPAAPPIMMKAEGDRLVCEIKLSLDLAAEQYQLGLSAVIEEKSGRKSYWALSHPGGAPDFHHDTCFAAHLPPPEAS